MLVTYFWVGVAFAIPELVIVNNWPWLKTMLDRNPIVEIIFSLVLSIVFGAAMGIGSGVTFAVGNVFSTMITKVIYSLHLLDKWREFKVAWTRFHAQVKQTAAEFAQIIHIVLAVLLFPVKVFVAFMRFLNRIAEWNAARHTHTTA